MYEIAFLNLLSDVWNLQNEVSPFLVPTSCREKHLETYVRKTENLIVIYLSR